MPGARRCRRRCSSARPPAATGRCRPGRRPASACTELGIDLAGRIPRRLTHELAEQADVVVTMGCGDECPFVPGKRYVDWDLADPKGRPLDEVRATRDEIAGRVDALVAELDRSTAIV